MTICFSVYQDSIVKLKIVCNFWQISKSKSIHYLFIYLFYFFISFSKQSQKQHTHKKKRSKSRFRFKIKKKESQFQINRIQFIMTKNYLWQIAFNEFVLTCFEKCGIYHNPTQRTIYTHIYTQCGLINWLTKCPFYSLQL